MKLNRPLLYFFLTFFVFAALVFYNAKSAQKQLGGNQSQVSLKLIDPPVQANVGRPTTISWQIDTDANFATSQTALYYSQTSSPSALLTSDSPEAAGYSDVSPDYLNGSFTLPDTFDVSLTFDKPTTIFYRAYTKVNNNHYWTPEYTLKVQNVDN